MDEKKNDRKSGVAFLGWVAFALITAQFAYISYKQENKIKEKDAKISELEEKLWEKRLDSQINASVTRLRAKLDSTFKSHFPK